MDNIRERDHSSTKLLDVNDVAKYLKISRSFAYKLVKEGKIPAIRINRCVRVLVEDLEDFVIKNRTNWKVS